MEADWRRPASGLLFAVTLATTFYGFLKLDSPLAVSFSASGEAGSSMTLLPGLLIAPVLSAAVYFLLSNLRRFDPLSENYESFEESVENLKVLVVGIFAYIQLLLVSWNLGFKFNFSRLMFPVVFSMYLYASDLMSKADRNWFFGIRNPWTISSERVWDRTHEAASRWFKVAAFLTAPAVLYPDYSVQLYAAPAFLLALGSTVYSYWLYMEG